eukprot:COSAG03_NODE_22342_length_292_cov_0.803109_1_plen_25_part_10
MAVRSLAVFVAGLATVEAQTGGAMP